METLGTWLHQTREAAGSTLGDAEEATHIRLRFLEMLEAGEFAAFPGGDVQVRGFLRIYARYLGLLSDEVLARYDAEMRSARIIPPSTPAGLQPALPDTLLPQGVTATMPRPRWLNTERLVIAGIVLVSLVAVVIGTRYLLSQNAGNRETAATATPLASASLSDETPTAPIVTPTFPVNPQGGVTLALEATEHVWACVMVDGTAEFEGMLATGQTESWSGREMVIVDTGNGAGLLVTVNGQSQGTMCGRGEVCSRAWGPHGEIAVPQPAPAP